MPAALVEAGERGRIDDAPVGFIVDGVVNAMRGLRLLNQSPAAEHGQRVILDEIEVYAHTSGLFLSRVSAGDHIEPGQDLGQIVDYLGRPVERFTSEWSGVVLGVIGPAMVEGRFPLVVGVRA
jgi:predicted deacylase